MSTSSSLSTSIEKMPQGDITGPHSGARTLAPPLHERLPRQLLGLRVGWEHKAALFQDEDFPSRPDLDLPDSLDLIADLPDDSLELDLLDRVRREFNSCKGSEISAANGKDSVPTTSTADRDKFIFYLPGCYVDGADHGKHHFHWQSSEPSPRVPPSVDTVDYLNLSGMACYRPLSSMTVSPPSRPTVFALDADRHPYRPFAVQTADVRRSAPEVGEAGYNPAPEQYFHPKALRHLWAGVGTLAHFDLGGAYTKRFALLREEVIVCVYRRGGPIVHNPGKGRPKDGLRIGEGAHRVTVTHTMAPDAWRGGALEVDYQPQPQPGEMATTIFGPSVSAGASLSFRAISYTIVLEGAAATAIIKCLIEECRIGEYHLDHIRRTVLRRRRGNRNRQEPLPRDDDRILLGSLKGERFLRYCEEESAPSDRAALVEFNLQWKCGKSRRRGWDAATQEAQVWQESRAAADLARSAFLNAAKVLSVPVFSTRVTYGRRNYLRPEDEKEPWTVAEIVQVLEKFKEALEFDLLYPWVGLLFRIRYC